MEKERFDELIGEELTIGIPHREIKYALFFYTGFLTKVTNKHIELRGKYNNYVITLENIKFLKIPSHSEDNYQDD